MTVDEILLALQGQVGWLKRDNKHHVQQIGDRIGELLAKLEALRFKPDCDCGSCQECNTYYEMLELGIVGYVSSE